MNPLVTLSLKPVPDDFYHASKLLCGMDALERDGLIRFRIECSTQCPIAALRLRVDLPDGSSRLIGIDLSDHSDHFDPELLAVCSTYLKRSFHRPDVEKLPMQAAARVRPYGLNHACTTRRSNARVARAFLLDQPLSGLVASLQVARYLTALPAVSAFEQDPHVALEPTIVFQTRVWEAEEVDGEAEAEQINEQRVCMVRALRKAFGERFRGGLMPTRLALARYPAEISPIPSRRRLYTTQSKRSLIGIYTSGLFNSTAFKLSEYLAASQCVVAEPLRNEEQPALNPGEHFLPFRDVDSCVSACERLLREPGLAVELRRTGNDYYRRHVAPRAHARCVLHRGGIRLDDAAPAQARMSMK